MERGDDLVSQHPFREGQSAVYPMPVLSCQTYFSNIALKLEQGRLAGAIVETVKIRVLATLRSNRTLDGGVTWPMGGTWRLGYLLSNF